jgi:hypothetical protein
VNNDYTFVRIAWVDENSYDPVDARDFHYWGYLQQKKGELFNTLSGAKSSVGHSKRMLKGDTSNIKVGYELGKITEWTEIV